MRGGIQHGKSVFPLLFHSAVEDSEQAVIILCLGLIQTVMHYFIKQRLGIADQRI
jgi:hypothetical protein